jgi:hypothetical protein
MKKILFAASVFMCIQTFTSLVCAQDTTGVEKPSMSSSRIKSAEPSSQEDQFRKEDRIEIPKDQVPPSLRKTLDENEQFAGWENAKLYVDRTTDEFILHMNDGTGTRTYRFNKMGRLVNPEGTDY